MSYSIRQHTSPLTVEELINSLNDPRLYVRFEAIISITRHRTNDRTAGTSLRNATLACASSVKAEWSI